MINNIMDKKDIKENPAKTVEQKETKQTKTNEKYGLYFSSSLKITDKDSGKVLLQMRCD